ncbi:glycosyltransferase [Fusobacterium sp. FSA-380-WT-2B]|uniref:glycosyltransferase n=2 Tax=Fusobacterium TaxID=848 RepID=UPI0012B3E208|nr:glycosyltransferase [Fusobacterium sp. FSA-380-WT-2B]MSS61185.1 glycosyltransferase [Fusobacterium sp. FSA-380-WT-2B]
MNGIFLSFVSSNEIGVTRKIKSQIVALNKISKNLKVFQVIDEFFYFQNQKIGRYYKNDSILNKIYCKLSIFKFLRGISKEKYYKDIEYIYIRFFGITPFFISYLKFLKQLNIIIFLEIPTFPYEYENTSILSKVLNFIDRKYQKELKFYVDRVITFSNDKYIYGIKCLNISNGIGEDNFFFNKKKLDDNFITFISVSNCSFWHGIDRFLYSLIQYQKNSVKERIRFYIIGEGNETLKLKKIVESNNELQDIVIFYGFKSGKELNEIYNKSDIAIGSLGRFRTGINIMKSLKNREYCAKGLPMIYSEIDLDFEGKKFVYKVSHDESLIDIAKVIRWYKNLKVSSKEIREYSKRFSWDIQMKKVLDEIEELKR